jgi:ribosomal protein S27AE
MKKTRLYSVLFNKCPRCHKGNFFEGNNAYNFSNFTKQNERCPVCGVSFMREVGFYYGAMYASYGLNVLLGILLFVFTNVIFDWGIHVFLYAFIASAIILWPVLYRLGRLIWINIFVGPEKPKVSEKSI